MSAIECNQLGLAKPLYDGKHCCVRETQREIPVLIKKLQDAHIVDHAELHDVQASLPHVQQEAEKGLGLKTPASQSSSTTTGAGTNSCSVDVSISFAQVR